MDRARGFSEGKLPRQSSWDRGADPQSILALEARSVVLPLGQGRCTSVCLSSIPTGPNVPGVVPFYLRMSLNPLTPLRKKLGTATAPFSAR
jgi:hypothetical protein